MSNVTHDQACEFNLLRRFLRPETQATLDTKDLSSCKHNNNPPAEGYDFILHVGAGRPGGLHVERLGHKSGYYNPDVDGKYAPVIDSTVPALSPDESQADVFEQERLGSKGKESKKNRGFGKEYDEFSEELTTKIDVDSLIQSLNTEGFLVSPHETIT